MATLFFDMFTYGLAGIGAMLLVQSMRR